MGYGFADPEGHHRAVRKILGRYRWQFAKGEAEFEGLDLNLLIETAIDAITPEPENWAEMSQDDKLAWMCRLGELSPVNEPYEVS